MRSDPSGAQLCYKALPHYQATVQERKAKFGSKNLITNSRRHLLEEENQPIHVANEHELAYLYLGENYNRFSVCDISQLDLDAILTIIAKASCFSTSTRTQAAKIKANVVDQWMRVVVEEWTPEKTCSAFSDMKSLAQSKSFHEKLEQAQNSLEVDHPLTEALLNIRRYRESIRNGSHDKIEEKLQRLGNTHGKEVFVKRRYRVA